jgi:hypothetical protein
MKPKFRIYEEKSLNEWILEDRGFDGEELN